MKEETMRQEPVTYEGKRLSAVSKGCGRCGEPELYWVYAWNDPDPNWKFTTGKMDVSDSPYWLDEDMQRWEKHICPEIRCRQCDEPIVWVSTKEGWRVASLWNESSKVWIDQFDDRGWPRHICPKFQRRDSDAR